MLELKCIITEMKTAINRYIDGRNVSDSQIFHRNYIATRLRRKMRMKNRTAPEAIPITEI